MKNLILFLKSKKFRYHFLASLAVGFLILWVLFLSIGNYTDHGEYIEVPDLSSVNEAELGPFLANYGLRHVVLDSVFDEKAQGGKILRQDPEAGESVKLNRIIYVTVSSKLPPLVKMPNLVDASMRQAQTMIETYGLKLGKREYKSDPCLNCVLAQMINGKKVEPGTMIPKGTPVDLVLGKGQEGEQIGLPCLSGLHKQEAMDRLAESGLILGSVDCKDCKTSNDQNKAIIIRQDPPCSNEDPFIAPGTPVNITMSLQSALSKESNDAQDE